MLSVIIAYVNEYPQVLFTIRAIAEELKGVDFEIIAINNYCEEVVAQGRPQDKGAGAIKAAAEGNPWLIPLEYDTKLSHWQAKNLGVQKARGKFLWFPDAHVVPSRNSLVEMLEFYRWNWERLNGTLHMPIGYQILEWRKLIYGLEADPKIGKYFYVFAPMPEQGLGYGEKILAKTTGKVQAFEVPVMSTCGCLMHRNIYDKLGGWPEEIGIYGGGEPFFNFSMAVLGMKKFIWPSAHLYHYGEERGYHWNQDGWIRDELIAAYCFGGYELLELKAKNMNGHPLVIRQIVDSILDKPSIQMHRQHINSSQVINVEEWIKPWLK